MKFKFLFVALLVVVSSVGSYADDGLDISYKLPFVPLEIVFDSDGISFRGTKTIVIPIGSFSLGYSKYASKFDEEYTYVIIEDMNLRKEHIYKIKDKKKLKLVSEGRTEITVTKNRVRILLEKGSTFKVSFSVEGEEESTSSNSNSKWIDVSSSTCSDNGGEMRHGVCYAHWENAKTICSQSGGQLPSIEELKEVVVDCGGVWEEWEKNRKNSSYQSCYKAKGFSDYTWYWTREEHDSSYACFVGFETGLDGWDYKSGSHYVRCVRAGQ